MNETSGLTPLLLLQYFKNTNTSDFIFIFILTILFLHYHKGPLVGACKTESKISCIFFYALSFKLIQNLRKKNFDECLIIHTNTAKLV